jgi:hypothetical protein
MMLMDALQDRQKEDGQKRVAHEDKAEYGV